MNNSYPKNITKSQNEYQSILCKYESQVNSNELSISNICMLLDEVKCFWIKQRKLIELELELLSKEKTCFVLSGALYLGIAEYEHYYFKSLGDYHIISDPFYKLERFFRRPEKEIDKQGVIKIFKEAYFDVLNTLKTYGDEFYFIPVQMIAAEDEQLHLQFIEDFFWSFISSIFGRKFNNREEFFDIYSSLDKIERDLDKKTLSYLIFNDYADAGLSLIERVSLYRKTLQRVSLESERKSDVEIFFLGVWCYLSQVTDILYVCAGLRITPYIRSNLTLHYFILVMETFKDDIGLRQMIEKTIVCATFYNYVDENIFSKLTFLEYCDELKQHSLLGLILDRMHIEKIDASNGNLSGIKRIIKSEIRGILTLDS